VPENKFSVEQETKHLKPQTLHQNSTTKNNCNNKIHLSIKRVNFQVNQSCLATGLSFELDRNTSYVLHLCNLLIAVPIVFLLITEK